MTKSFQLSIHAGRYATYAVFLRRHLLEACRLIRAPLKELSIVLVGDRAMGDLHLRFMGLPDPTDVLTFPLELDPRGRELTGEVIVCVPYARRSAKSHRTGVQNELLLYALHGMLHLCGFDDRTERGFAQMHRKEDRILQQLGVGAVFAPRIFQSTKLSAMKGSSVNSPSVKLLFGRRRERAGKRNH